MLDSSAVNETHENPSTRQGWALALAALAIAVCLFGNLGAIGLTGPDEARYAWIARAMAETGDWITPRLWGQPWFEKPVLYYWGAAVGFWLHLPAEWAARLPSAFAALAATLAIGWLAKKHYGGDAGSLLSPALLAPLIFATSVGAIGFARAATPDMLLSGSLALAMASAAEVLRQSGALRAADGAPSANVRRDLWSPVAFGAFLGLGVLAKGPAAIILAGGSLGIWALGSKQWRPAMRLAHPLAVGAFSIVAIPWYAVCALRNPDFLRVFFWLNNFQRYTTPLYQHRQPLWYFAPILLLALLPWTVLLWPAARQGLRRREKSWAGSPGFFYACWAVWPVVFFSFSQSKLPGYILPALAPLAMVCAIALARTISEREFRTRMLLMAIGATWLVISIVAAYAAPRHIQIQVIGPVTMGPGLFGALVALLIAAVLIVAALRARPVRAILLCAVLVAAAVEIVSVKMLPSIDRLISARPHAEFMRNDQHPDRIFAYRLARHWQYSLAFYFHRELPEWSPDDPGPALVLTNLNGLDQITKLGRVSGEIEQTQPGLVYVPVLPAPLRR
jgi:4-amino-4-deoxy-L-arabinose transferase-like glycosyltransferase